MKRNLIVVCVLTGLVTAFFGAVAFLGFWYNVLVAGVLGAVMAAVSLWVLMGSVWRERCYEKFDRHFDEHDFYAAKLVLDKASKNVILYPVFRSVAGQLYMKAYMALDDISATEHYVSLLRRIGGAGWRYRTAFFFILLNLEWKDISAARGEFEDFRQNCGHAEIYREQIQILTALFALIDGKESELPDSVKNSPYPVVHRLLERH
ncbi:MAG: hypothetical protein K2N74_05205 [Clostridiales bacterium]|nr:hypothetical protein [Clostridiales bacterium]